MEWIIIAHPTHLSLARIWYVDEKWVLLRLKSFDKFCAKYSIN